MKISKLATNAIKKKYNNEYKIGTIFEYICKCDNFFTCKLSFFIKKYCEIDNHFKGGVRRLVDTVLEF